MKRLPVVINMFTKIDAPFSFLVKERLGVYHIYDYEEVYRLKIKREFPVRKLKTKSDADLCSELFKTLDLHVKRISDTEFLFVDPTYEEYEDVDLPLYKMTEKKGTYTYLNTSYILKNVPTKKTVKKAYEYMLMCQDKINRAVIKEDIEYSIESGNDTVSTVYTNSKDISKILNPEEFLIFHISIPYRNKTTYSSLVISKERAKQAAKNGMIKICVPKDVAGIVIGKSGKNIKELSEKLGLKISVLAY